MSVELIDRGVDPDDDFEFPCCPYCDMDLRENDSSHKVISYQVDGNEWEHDIQCPRDTRAIAFNRGYDAFNGGPCGEVPYPDGSSEYNFFIDGYDMARMHQEEIDATGDTVMIAPDGSS